MTTFADNVFDIFSRLCEKHGFVPATAYGDNGFASLVKKVTDECYGYVFAYDNRSGGGEVVVSFWVAPPDSPDDSLDKLGVGYKIQIASAFDVDDEFFESCEERIINLLPALGALSEVIDKEVSHQTVRSQRWVAYQHERQAIESLKKMANDQADAACAKALDTARNVAKSEKPFSSLENACVAAAKSLLENNALPENTVRFYGEDADFFSSCLASHLYVEALGNTDLQKGV